MRRSLLGVVLSIGATVLVAPTPSDAAAGWTQVSAPALKYGGGLAGVSCAKPSACSAVGFFSTGDPQSRTSKLAALAEWWNASGLKRQSDPAGPSHGVSCVTAHFCIEVGYLSPSGTEVDTAAKWNGTRWRAMSMPKERNGYLEAVSCWSRAGCVAVGSYIPASYSRPLVMRWNGASWKKQKAPTANQYLNHLTGVSCVSGSSCVAVGQTFVDPQGSNSKTLAERWNGRSWRIVSTPTLRKTYQPELDSVSCISAKHCVAVGGAPQHSLILLWTGSGFVRQKPAAPVGRSSAPLLTGVSCQTSTFCMATGEADFPEGYRAELWDGNQWTMSTMPGGGPNDTFDAVLVSCPSTTMCLAAGMYLHHQTEYPLVDEWTAS